MDAPLDRYLSFTGEIPRPKHSPLAMRMPDATHVQNHAIAARARTTGKRLPSLSSDATSSEVLKRLFTMEVTRRAKATAMTPMVKTEVGNTAFAPCEIRAGRTSTRI